MKQSEWVLAVAVLGALVGAGVVSRWQYARAAKFEAQARAAEAEVKKSSQAIALLKVRADSLDRRAVQIDTVVRTKIVRIAVLDRIRPAPDTCRPWVAARDSLIAAQQAQNLILTAGIGVRDSQITLLASSKTALAAALSARTRPARILGLFPAPSRTETFVIGAALGFLISSRVR